MLNIGIAGIGKMGKIHLRVLSELPGCNLAGIYDIDRDQSRNLADQYHTEAFDSYEDLLSRADALIIATPTTTHKDMAFEAIRRKKHIFVEKPLAQDSRTALSIFEEAKRHGVKLMVGHVERFNPVVQKLKEILSEKEPLVITITRVGPYPPRIQDTGIILDLSIHDIDILNYLLSNEPEKLNCFKSRFIGKHEDTAIISFKFNNCLAHIVTNWLTPFKVRKIEVATIDEYFVGDLIDQKLTRYSRYTEDGAFVSYEIPIKHREPVREELMEFINSIVEDRQPSVDGEIAVKNIEIAERCLRSEDLQ